jgi:hypothetical protein
MSFIPELTKSSDYCLERYDGVADADDSADEDVGIDSRPMRERLDDPGARHLLEMRARLAELHAEALDLADAEALPDEGVDVHIADRHLPSSLAGPQADILDNLGGDERQRLAGGSALVVEMTIAFEPLPGDGPHLLDSPQFGHTFGTEMNRLYRHVLIMHE